MSEITVVLEVSEVAVIKQDFDLDLVQLVQSVGLTSPGPQGPRGPAGPAGAAGGSVYEHVQSAPSSVWVITHNLGRKVHVSLFGDEGEVILSDVEHGSVNQATVTWSSPTTGSAVVS